MLSDKFADVPAHPMLSKIMNGVYKTATVIHEDEKCLAFKEVDSVSSVHFLVIPKKWEGKDMRDVKETPEHTALMGHLLLTAANVAKKIGLEKGFRTLVNNGCAGTKDHQVGQLIVQVIGGQKLTHEIAGKGIDMLAGKMEEMQIEEESK
jgi:histidine triad (HIT) family protein